MAVNCNIVWKQSLMFPEYTY
ncbi:hypothetical protein AVEN_176445-1, partial [Araneus ventricosus]